MSGFSNFLDNFSVNSGPPGAGLTLQVPGTETAPDRDDMMGATESRPLSSLSGDFSDDLSFSGLGAAGESSPLAGNGRSSFTSNFASHGSIFRSGGSGQRSFDNLAELLGEDPSPYIQKYAHIFHLEANDKQRLEKVMHSGAVEREVFRTALFLKIHAEVKIKKDMDAQVLAIPPNAKTYIDKYILRVLLSPELASYGRPVPHNILFQLTAAKRWGLPEDLAKDETGIADMVKKFFEKGVTQRKSDIKKEIGKGINTSGEVSIECPDILTLTKKLSQMGKLRNLNINVTPQLCARVAFLRKVYLDHPNEPKFWPIAGGYLADIRNKANGDPQTVTRIFAQILEDDRLKFKKPNLDALQAISPSDTQADTDSLVGGNLADSSLLNSTADGDEDEE